MYKTYTTKVYRDIDIFINKTVFLNAGESVTFPLNNVGLSVNTYDRRHYVTQGGFKFEGKNLQRNASMAPMQDNIGRIWPDIDDANIRALSLIDSFNIIPTEDNSCYLCIRTCSTVGSAIKHENFNVNSGDNFTLSTGNLYIANINLTIDNINIVAHTPIPVIKNNKNIIINENGRISRFYSTGNL